MEKTVAIVHYNTPELTAATVRSVQKHTPGCHIVVFDNSDTRPFPLMDGVTVIDNTKGQLIDFDALLDKYPDKVQTVNNHASSKHIASVDALFDIIPGGFVLLDSDVLIKKDISPFFDESVAWAGKVEYEPKFWFMTVRCFPFLLWINVPACRKKGIRFWHEGKAYKLSHEGVPYYDTGGSFYEDCIKARLPYREVEINDYIEHLVGGSYAKRDWRVWLDEHRALYEMVEEKPKKSKDGKILVVIPYCSEGAQGRELEYAVAGWRRHFKEDYLIVLAGENHPVTETGDDIICIESRRVDPIPGQYRQHLDYVSCFKKVRAAFPESEGFIFVADDCYAVNDFDLTDVKFLKQINYDFFGNANCGNGWQRDQAKTKAALVAAGLPSRNFTTHLPQWYEWDKLEALWKVYDMEHNSFVMENLYFNTYYPTRVPMQLNIDYDNLKCGVYRSNPRMEYIEDAFKSKIWITNSPVGWIPELDRMLADYYKI